MPQWKQRINTELGLTWQPRELASIAAFGALSFVGIAATMGGLLIPAYFGGLLLVGISKNCKIKRAGIGLMILVLALFQRIWPSTPGA